LDEQLEKRQLFLQPEKGTGMSRFIFNPASRQLSVNDGQQKSEQYSNHPY
jgi:hypothetical protein